MLRRLAAILAVLSIIGTCGIVVADELPPDGTEYVEVVFDDETDLSEAKKTLIINHLLGLDPGVSPYNLLCIFGHDKTSRAVIVTKHNFYQTDPKCLEQIYEVEFCKRENCDYMVETLLSTMRTSCH